LSRSRPKYFIYKEQRGCYQIAQLIIHKYQQHIHTTTDMMVEDNISSGDVENQSQPAATTDTTATNPYSKNYTHKKWKVIALASFLLVAVVLAITLPLTIGSNNSKSTDSSNGSSTNSDGGKSKEGVDDSSTQDGASSTDNYLGASSPTVQVYKSQFLDSNGPIKAQVRIMDPSVAGKSALVLFYECVPCKS